ncbi:MAG: hypothetical protein AB1481_02030 [Candidatus Omnitrophota bacterium]
MLNAIRYTFLAIFLFTSCGCDAFVRKFTRKPKKESMPAEELVLAPQEYTGPAMSTEELYRQYFLFWKSWQDELISALSSRASQKKQLDCINEAIENLVNLREYLKEDRKKILDKYITESDVLKQKISIDIYSNNASLTIREAERIRRNILRDLSFSKVKDSLI